MSTRIYIIGPEFGPVKIGIAKRPLHRLMHLQVANYETLILHGDYGVPDSMDALQVEQFMHGKITAMGRHIRGEWFDFLPSEAIEYVIDVINSGKLDNLCEQRRLIKSSIEKDLNRALRPKKISLRPPRAVFDR